MAWLVLLLLSVSTAFSYPAHWWSSVDPTNAPSWEIFPQSADPGEVILSKRNELGLLSNFAATPFEFHGKRYASLEGFWQSMLYPESNLKSEKDPRFQLPSSLWKFRREEVEQMTGFTAKEAGDLALENMKKLGINWVSFEGRRFPYYTSEKAEHYRLIYAATVEKVRQNSEVRKVLLSTGGLKLRPDHVQEPKASPAWKYFEILMEIRDSKNLFVN